MRPVGTRKKKRDFDPHAFLASIGEGRKILSFRKKQTIFSQGDAADAVFYLQKGKVKLTVVSKTGREATIGLLTDSVFFGEGSLAGQALRMCSATAVTDCIVLRAGASPGAGVFRHVRGVFIGPKYPLRGRPG